jgi:hypothetical protein
MLASPPRIPALERHEHVCVNGKWSCRHRVVRLKRKVVNGMGVFTSRHDSTAANSPGGRWAAADSDLAGTCPALLEFLTEREDENGKPRVTSTLLVAAEDGVWKACLTDRAQVGGKFDYKLWKTGMTLADALQALDRDLQEGTAEWRKFPKWEPQKRR